MEGQTNFLFWNVHKNAVEQHLFRLIDRWQLSVIALAESPYLDADMERIINQQLPQGAETFSAAPLPPSGIKPKVQILTRLRRPGWQPAFEHLRYTGWALTLNNGQRLLYVTVHFPSAQYDQGDGQRAIAIELRHDMMQTERRAASLGFDQSQPLLTLIIGDFNASPFDAGIAGFYGLNATSSREIALTQDGRVFYGTKIPFLYNPMWRFLGDMKTPGTWYKRLSSPVCHDWYLLDQALFSPALTPYLDEENDADAIRILTEDADVALGGSSLMKNGKPNSAISDHLPIFVRLNI